MKEKFLAFLVLFAITLALFFVAPINIKKTKAAGLADSQWPTEGFNSQRIGRANYPTIYRDPDISWRFLTGDTRDGMAPIVAPNGTIIIANILVSPYPLIAIDPTTGVEKWRKDGMGKMASRSIVVDRDNVVYVANIGYIKGYNVDTGNEVFSKDIWAPATLVPTGLTLDSQGNLYLSYCYAFAFVSGIAKINTLNGLVAWNRFWGDYYVIQPVSLSEDESTAYFGLIYYSHPGTPDISHTYLYAINTSNSFDKWTYQHPTDFDYYSYFPLVGGNGVVYVASDKGTITAHQPQDGVVISPWPKDIGAKAGHLAEDFDGTLLAVAYCPSGDTGCSNILRAFNSDGSDKWSNSILDQPAAIGITANMIYVKSLNSGLFGIDKNGERKWSKDTGIAANLAISNDGIIYVNSRDGYLYAITGDMTPPPTPSTSRKVKVLIEWQELGQTKEVEMKAILKDIK